MKYVYIKSFFLILGLILSLSSIGQSPYMWQLTDEDGLPSMTVYKINQDKKGFIWGGTENGIFKFDGKVFKTYESPLLKDKEILTIKVDSKDRIWFNNIAGQLFYIENEEIFQFNPEGILSNSQVIHWIKILNSLWIVFIDQQGKRNLLRINLDHQGAGIDHLIFDFKVPPDFILLNDEVKIYITGYFNDDELSRKRSIKIIDITTNNEIGKIIDVPLSKIPLRNYKKIITPNKLKADCEKMRDVLIPFIKENKVPHYALVDNNNLSFVGKEGIHQYDFSTTPVKLKSHLLPEIDVNHFFIDKENNYWVSTNNKGIYVIPSFSFINYTSSNSNLGKDFVYDLAKISNTNTILIGLNSGVINTLKNEKIGSKIKLPTNGRVVKIKPHKDKIWVGTDRGLFYTDQNFKSINKSTLNTIKDISIDQNNHIWLGLSDATYCYCSSTINATQAPSYPSIGKTILNRRTYAVYNDFENKMWIGTTKGLFTYDKETLLPFKEFDEVLPYNISSIIQTKDSTIWVGTYGEGLLAIKRDSIISKLKITNGLASNTIKTLLSDENFLWIGTSNGLNRVNLLNGTIDLINKIDGLPSNEINAVIKQEKQLLVGTPKGLCSFPIDSIKINSTPPPIYINSIKINERDTSLLEKYELDYAQNNLVISFIGLSYRSRDNVSYQYRMLGIDTSWVTTQSRVVRFPGLRSGKYTFEVNAFNSDKVGNKKPISIQFNIATPWWQTLWFKIGSFLLVALIGVIATSIWFKIKQKQLQQEQDFKEKINALRMQALQAQMNPHFVFNALNAIQKYITTNEQEAAMLYLSRFAKLIRTIFEHSKEKKITLEKELAFLNLYLNLEKLRFKNKIEIDFNVDPNIRERTEEIKIPPLLIQPIIENAFKYGLMHKTSKGKLSIHFELVKNLLYCTVEDNGVGRDKSNALNVWRSKEHQSSGIKTTEERLSILNQNSNPKKQLANIEIIDLFDDQNNPRGTKVILRIKTI